METRDLKEKLEEALGQELSTVEFINWRAAVATYEISPDSDFSHTASRNLLFPEPNECARTQHLDVSGWAGVGSSGTSSFRVLQDFTCVKVPRYYTLGPPINVVATPRGPTPCFLTTEYSFVNDRQDVEITVFAWDTNGAAAPGIFFDWRCRVGWPSIF